MNNTFVVYNFLGNDTIDTYSRYIRHIKVIDNESIVSASMVGDTLTLAKSVDGDIDIMGRFGDEEYSGLVRGTDHNPLLGIFCKSVRFYDDVETHIKYIPVKDGVFITLISGLLGIEMPDGRYLVLDRCCELINDEREYKVYTAKDFKDMNTFKDDESGVIFSYHVVSDCTVKVRKTMLSAKFCRENFTKLTEAPFEDGKKRLEENKRKIEEEGEAKRKSMEEFAKQQKLKEDKEELAKAEKSSKTTKKQKVAVLDSEDGAAMFRDFMNSIQK